MCVDDIAPLNVGSPKINRPYAKLMGTLAIVITQGFLLGGGRTQCIGTLSIHLVTYPPWISTPPLSQSHPLPFQKNFALHVY